jgi:transposase-like protein
MTIEAVLGAEMAYHLGYPKHGQNDSELDTGSNTRNGYYSKTVKGSHGEVDLIIPRDRNASFEPSIIEKGKTRLGTFDGQILSRYAKGMSTRDILS